MTDAPPIQYARTSEATLKGFDEPVELYEVRA